MLEESNYGEQTVPIYYFWDSVTYGGSFINDNETFTYISCLGILNWSCHNVGVNGYGILNMIARSRYDTRINNSPIRIFTFISADFDRGLQILIQLILFLESPSYTQRIMGSIKFYCYKNSPEKMVWKAIWYSRQRIYSKFKNSCTKICIRYIFKWIEKTWNSWNQVSNCALS